MGDRLQDWIDGVNSIRWAQMGDKQFARTDYGWVELSAATTAKLDAGMKAADDAALDELYAEIIDYARGRWADELEIGVF